eukprot:1998925-Rhodomonas_salina.1
MHPTHLISQCQVTCPAPPAPVSTVRNGGPATTSLVRTAVLRARVVSSTAETVVLLLLERFSTWSAMSPSWSRVTSDLYTVSASKSGPSWSNRRVRRISFGTARCARACIVAAHARGIIRVSPCSRYNLYGF